MNTRSASIIFEYPLNEKMRAWLRIEHLLHYLFSAEALESSSQILFFFNHLGSLLALLDRYDIRTDLIKDLEQQKKKLAQWSNMPGVDMEKLEQLKQQLQTGLSRLIATPRLGQSLYEHAIINDIRKHLIIPGGYRFDLPLLHLWMHQPLIEQRQQIAHWLTALNSLHHPLKLQLMLLRQSVPFQGKKAIHGFYKGKSEENYDLLRLQLFPQEKIYPKISAHKNYFAICFLHAHAGEQIPETLPFNLACC